MEKIQSTILTMKIGYCIINSLFKYHLSCLNDNLNYKPPNHKPIRFIGLLLEQGARPTMILKYPSLSMMVVLEMQGLILPSKLPMFHNIVTNSNQHVLTDNTLIVTYQNHGLNNASHSAY